MDPSAQADGHDPVSHVDTDIPVMVRPARETDAGLVFDSWRRSYSDARTARAPTLEAYITSQRAVIAEALRTSEVAVLCPESDPDLILGWICWRGVAVLHWLYVKEPYRRRGFARALFHHALGDAPVSALWITHGADGLRSGSGFLAWLRSCGVRVNYNPGLVFG